MSGIIRSFSRKGSVVKENNSKGLKHFGSEVNFVVTEAGFSLNGKKTNYNVSMKGDGAKAMLSEMHFTQALDAALSKNYDSLEDDATVNFTVDDIIGMRFIRTKNGDNFTVTFEEVASGEVDPLAGLTPEQVNKYNAVKDALGHDAALVAATA